MFTTFSLKKENPITEEERQALFLLLELYQNSSHGRWLFNLPWQSYRYHWCEAMRDSAVLGAFAPSKGRAIFLQPYNQNGKLWIETIASTVVHELRHAWQYERHPVKYVASSLPLVREFTLERDAKATEENASHFFSSILNERVKQAFEERVQRRKKNEH